jgi:hypothetical protein
MQRTFSKSLRRGAWYPVVRDELPDRVTIIMDGHPMDVPRRILEVRRHRPRHFSVINRVGDQTKSRRESLYNLGKYYAVCPRCAHRFALWGQPEEKQCPQCGHDGPVGWWEE